MTGANRKPNTTARLQNLQQSINGLRVRIIRRSPKTGTYTVELLEAQKAYKVGDQIHVKGFELGDD